jgi:hypothetical protein
MYPECDWAMTRADVTVITATIPGREDLLKYCLGSVYNQTVEVRAHLVMAQSCTEGFPPQVHVAQQQNQLLKAVDTTWTMRLADDDQLLPSHIEALLPSMANADVVYSFDASQNRPRYSCNELTQREIVNRFEVGNWIDGSAVAIRTELLKAVGGWSTEWEGGKWSEGGHYIAIPRINAEDWMCFYMLANQGARFVCVPEDTWYYGSGDWVRSSTDV